MDNVDTAQQGGVVLVRPDPAVNVDAIPAVLRERRQWVCWTYITRDDRQTKVPVRARDGSFASSTDPSTWATFEEAVAAWKANGYAGIGFVFTADDPFCGIDLDDCIDENGVIVPAAREIIDSFNSYCEVSPSGRGVKIFVMGRKPEGVGCRSKAIPGFKETEIYDHGRFFTVTGRRMAEAPGEVHDGQAALAALCARLWPQNQRSKQTRSAASGGFPGNDQALIAKACAAKNGEAFRKLWAGDTSEHGGDDSVADLALCGHLAFWAGRDMARMDRLFRQSGLMRNKWDEPRPKGTYGTDTMAKAIEGCVNTYSPTGAGHGNFDANSHWNAAPPPQGYELTDLGNAERFAAAASEELRFCHGLGWLAWDGTRWGEDQRGRVITLAGEVVRAMAREAMDLRDPDKAQKLRDWAKSSESRARLESMVKLAEAQPALAVTTADLDQGGMLLNTQTGTIDLRTADCRPHQPSDLLTMIARTGYDPDATCPRFDEFLLEIFEGDVELVEYVRRLFGMCLTGDIREQILPIFHGPGANGKSVLIDTVLHVMGDYAGLAPPHLLEQRQHQEHPTELADLRGKRLVVASELDDDAKLKLSLVKRLTGDHTIKGRKMRQDYIEFPRTHKIILVTNNLPTFSEQTEAVWRRVRVIPFNYIVPEDRRDPKLLETLKAEAPGILRRLVHACRDWQQHGLGRSSAVELATAGYRTEQDEIGWYVGGFCEVDPKAFTPWDEVWRHYETCCRNQCVEPLAKAAFQTALTRAGWGTTTQKVDGHSRKGRRIRLKS